MTLRTLAALSLAALLAPAAGRAQDYAPDAPQPYDARYPDDGSDRYAADPASSDRSSNDGAYDVSVDADTSGPVTFDQFQQPLSQYGSWVTVGGYGTVWQPRVASGWRPYYYGRWEWTTEGWLWVSDEPFGWATYHYGRWAFDRGYGWLWVPGYQWAPAWVSWRYGGDVIGWAPLAPGLSLYVTDYGFVDAWWTFVPSGRFCGTPIYGVAYAPYYTRRWWDATRPAPPRPGGYRPGGLDRPGGSGRPIPASPAFGGPPPRFVEERSGRPLSPVRIIPTRGGERLRPGEIGVYRPDARPRPVGGSRDAWQGGSRERPAPAAPARGGRDDGSRGGPARDRAAPAPAGGSRYDRAPQAPAPSGGSRYDRVPQAPAPSGGYHLDRAPAPSGGRHEQGGGYRAPAPAAPAPAQAAPAPARAEPSHGGGAGGGHGGGHQESRGGDHRRR